MPIKRRADPPRARAILGASLAKRAHHAAHVRALRGNVQISAPLPVFRLRFSALSRRHPLRNARLTGWIYLLIGGEAMGLVHLRSSRRKLSFGGVTAGLPAQRLLRAATLADSELNTVKQAFEARILEIPPLRFHVLWLYARDGKSRFVELGLRGAATFKLESLGEIEGRIAAARRLIRSAR